MAKLVVKPLEKIHIKNVVYLHCKYLSGLLSELGPRITKIFYETALLWDGNFGYVCTEGDKCVGFAFVTSNNQEIFKKVIKKKPFKIFLETMISLVKKPSLLKKLIGSFFEKKNSTTCPELSYIAVDQDLRRKGIGSILIKTLNNEYRSRNIFYYELSVDKENEKARRFYEKIGFKLKYEFKQYGISRCRYYIHL